MFVMSPRWQPTGLQLLSVILIGEKSVSRLSQRDGGEQPSAVTDDNKRQLFIYICMQLGRPRRCKNNEMTENLRFIKLVRGEFAADSVAIIHPLFSKPHRNEQRI